MRWIEKRSIAAGMVLICMTGCVASTTMVTTAVVVPPPAPTPPATDPSTQPVATSARGTVAVVPGLAPKPKPFIALPKELHIVGGRPSTLLLEHASPDSPVPLSDYATQPVFTVGAFHLHNGLSQEDVTRIMGNPAQIADTTDPWLVYRLVGEREIWLHFSGESGDHLDAADVIRGAEDGYVRDRIFSADDLK